MSIGALAFLSPWLLTALAALPVIYWLLRTVPPRPRQIAFPPTRILVGLENKDKTPAKTPWWLTLIRMLAAAFVIFALADPVLNPTREAGLSGSGPLVLVVDNGWSSGGHFAQRTRLVDQLISEAENANRPVVIAPTASGAKTLTLRVEAPGAARTTAAALQPQPFAPDRAALAEQLARTLDGQKGLDVVWLSDGIDHDGKTSAFATALSQIASGGRLQVIRNRAGDEPLGLSAGLDRDGRLEAFVVRAEGAGRTGTALAFSARNQRLAETSYEIPAGSRRISARFDLPLELRNQVARIELAGERSAGAVHLLDSRSRWHRIALISGESREQAQPLLAPLYYIERALAPFAELVRQKDVNLAGAVAGAFEQRSSILVMADIGTIAGDLGARVQEWVNKGGVLVRFAGPRLEKGGDDLLPVGLRMGGRTLGGALSWSTPQPLAPFEDSSLFAGLTIPRDVAVNRQILADPAYLTDEVSVWARLADGTPLVTARRMGEGQIVLFHITANSDWSNLPLSGLFVEMLRRIATLGVSGGIAVGGPEVMAAPTARSTPAPETAEVLAPTQVLDGFGTLRPPTPTAQAIPARQIDTATPSLDHPPGYYGPTASPRALNVITPRTELRPLPSLPSNVEQRTYEGTNPEPLKPWLLSAALALIFADIIAVLLLQGLFRPRPRLQPAATASALLLAVAAALVLTSADASAQRRPEARPTAPPTAAMPSSRDLQIAIQATGKVSFAYVLTGDAATDEASRAGLVGIGHHLSARTSVEPGEPFGVNVTTDEIAFFPILYWPVLPNANPLPDATLAKIDTYMKQGGMIIFDTRDFGSGVPTGVGLGREGGTPLQRLIGRLDIPRLEPVPESHVLSKSFYILRTFPGRWDGGQMWVEADSAEPADGDTRKARRADGVSSILVTPNDLAAAWALDGQNRPMFPVVPGGEAQREMSIRVGINIVMYALTGNYKADQVHAPALIERLGQ